MTCGTPNSAAATIFPVGVSSQEGPVSVDSTNEIPFSMARKTVDELCWMTALGLWNIDRFETFTPSAAPTGTDARTSDAKMFSQQIAGTTAILPAETLKGFGDSGGTLTSMIPGTSQSGHGILSESGMYSPNGTSLRFPYFCSPLSEPSMMTSSLII